MFAHGKFLKPYPIFVSEVETYKGSYMEKPKLLELEYGSVLGGRGGEHLNRQGTYPWQATLD